MNTAWMVGWISEFLNFVETIIQKTFEIFSVHNLAPEDISVVAGVGDSITVCTEYRITEAPHISSFVIFWS